MPSTQDQLSGIEQTETPERRPSTIPTDKSAQDEVAHVLFVDIVGFTKLNPNEQRSVLEKLQNIIQNTDAFNSTRKNKRLIALPTGDGMALVFLAQKNSGVAVTCAEQTTKAVREHNEQTESLTESNSGRNKINIRMGIHSGCVVRVSDINHRLNVAGEGINTAQRVMDCGDIGHILISDKTCHFLPATPPRECDDLGEVKVKHDQIVHLFNLYNEVIGNKELPMKLRLAKGRRRRIHWIVGCSLAVLMAGIAAFIYFHFHQSAPKPLLLVAIMPSTSDPGIQKYSNQISDEIIKSLQGKTINQVELHFHPPDKVYKYIGKPEELRRRYQTRIVVTLEIALRDGRLSVTPQFKDYETGKDVRIQETAGNITDLLSLSHNIRAKIENQIETLIEQEQIEPDSLTSKSQQAYNIYADARDLWNERTAESLASATVLFEQSIKLDSSYAYSYAGLADCYIARGGLYMDPREASEEALHNLDRALELKPNLAQERTSKAMVLFWFKRDLETAGKEFEEALKLGTYDMTVYRWYSNYLIVAGKFDEAQTQLAKAQASEDKDKLLIKVAQLQLYYFKRDYQKAIDELGKDTNLANDPHGRRLLAQIYSQMKRYEEALNLYEARYKRYFVSVDPDELATLGYIFGRMKAERKALDILDKLKELQGEADLKKKYFPSFFASAVIYAGLAEAERDSSKRKMHIDKAYEALDKAIQESDVRSAWIVVDPRLDSLDKNGERFAQLRAKAFPRAN